MSFAQRTTAEAILWSPRNIELVDLVRADSPSFEDTCLYAMRFEVTIASDSKVQMVTNTICQVTLVFKQGNYFPPTIGCDVVKFDKATPRLSPDGQSLVPWQFIPPDDGFRYRPSIGVPTILSVPS